MMRCTYLADTERGSSGSPVFNSEWQMIALHHWGGPWIDGGDIGDPSSFEINEGIRISSIVRNLRKQMRGLPGFQQERLASALNAESTWANPSSTARNTSAPKSGASVEVAEDGTATWTVPLEVSVRIPALAGPPAPEQTVTPPQALQRPQNPAASLIGAAICQTSSPAFTCPFLSLARDWSATPPRYWTRCPAPTGLSLNTTISAS